MGQEERMWLAYANKIVVENRIRTANFSGMYFTIGIYTDFIPFIFNQRLRNLSLRLH